MTTHEDDIKNIAPWTPAIDAALAPVLQFQETATGVGLSSALVDQLTAAFASQVVFPMMISGLEQAKTAQQS